LFGQEFVADSGLMSHLLEEILSGGFKCAASLQINFDLLGELLKMNK
jgi:Trpc4-associated protein